MRKLKSKHCVECSELYLPTGSCSKYCPTCKPIKTKEITKLAIKKWSIKKGIFKGTGSGSATGFGKDNHYYKHGLSIFQKWAKEYKETIGICEECGKDIKDAGHYEWVGHHKDHDRTNNVKENLQVICKQCHQIHHECWKAFEKSND